MAGNADFANGKGNNRVVQPLNDRTLYQSKVSSSGATAVTTFGAAVIAAVAAFAF